MLEASIFVPKNHDESVYPVNTSEVDAGIMYIRWKVLMNRFFMEEVFVRRQQGTPDRQQVKTLSINDLIREAKSSITSQCSYLESQAGSPEPLVGVVSDDRILCSSKTQFSKRVEQDFKLEHDPLDDCYAKSYAHRLRRSFIEADARPPDGLRVPHVEIRHLPISIGM